MREDVILQYRGKYGSLKVDAKNHVVIEDDLDRDKILKDAGENPIWQQGIYGGIAAIMYYNLDSNKRDVWVDSSTLRSGVEIRFKDGWKLLIDNENTRFFGPVVHEKERD